MSWQHKMVLILGTLGCQGDKPSARFAEDASLGPEWESQEEDTEEPSPLDSGEGSEDEDSGTAGGTDSGTGANVDTGAPEHDTALDDDLGGDSGLVDPWTTDSGHDRDTAVVEFVDSGGLDGGEGPIVGGPDDSGPGDTAVDTGMGDEVLVDEDTAVGSEDSSSLVDDDELPALPPLDPDSASPSDTELLPGLGSDTAALGGEDTASTDEMVLAYDAPGAGDLFVSEIMANPDAVSDLAGEWFELYNPQARTFSLRGSRFTAADGDVFEVEVDVTIGPWSRVVFGVNGSVEENGGADVDVVYDRLDFSLDNFEDQIRMVNALGVTVSTVTYNRDWDRAPGHSFQLDRSSHYIAVAGMPSKWCLSSTAMSGGDLGTPHTVNEACMISDWDDDGYTEEDGDCDDEKDWVFPGADERWDGLDNDCDDEVDEVREAGATLHVEGRGSDYLGWYASVSSGDVNGDGAADLLVGGSLSSADERGRVWILDGGDVSDWGGHVAESHMAVIEGGGDYSYFGTMGPKMGDIDDDGVDDLLVVGTDAYASSAAAGVHAGSLFFGNAEFSGTRVETEADVLFQSSTAAYWYVSALSHVDVDSDGHDDVLIGNFYDSTTSQGDVFFFSGGTLGASEVYALEGDADLRLQGEAVGDYLGYGVAAGDLNGDGHVEMFVSAAGASVEDADRVGCVYMVSTEMVDMASGLSVSVADVASFKVCAATPHARLGRNAAPQLFDVNGDDLLDIVLSAPGADFGGTEDMGTVMVFINDGSFSGAISTTDADTTLTSGDARYFGNALHHADLDGDGEPELIVGAPDFDRFDDEVEYSGEVYVYRSSTLVAGGIIPVSEADLFIDGSGTTGFGSTLRSADFDRSGSDELIVAAPRWNGTMGRLGVFALD